MIADAKYGELLGAHLIGPGRLGVGAGAALAQKWDLTVNELARNVHIHPTLSEALQECFHGLAGHMINFDPPPLTSARRSIVVAGIGGLVLATSCG